MKYHDNEVIVIGKNGLYISDDSTFIVKDFRITSKQDPDPKNKINDIHRMSKNKFTFKVGRSKSDPVANWFNDLFSNYNDPGANNGDRTTFDHTAGGLNFAFKGELTLTVSGGGLSGATKVIFKDVCFAQGSSGASNNWWFAQKTGQHTRYGDDTLLTIGSDSQGRTVYASFLRGGNKVNEISLESICILSGSPRDRNYRVKDMPNLLSRFPKKKTTELMIKNMSMPTQADLINSHIQGFTIMPTSDYYVFSYNTTSGSYGRIMAGTKTGKKINFKSYKKALRHPGGIQAIGDYVVVPSEADKSASIALYDTRSLKVEELRRVEKFKMEVQHKAGAVGITDYENAQKRPCYLMIIGYEESKNNFAYHIYTADASKGIESATFTDEKKKIILDIEFQGFALLTGTDNRVYMLGLYPDGSGTSSYNDMMYLYEINTSNWSWSKLGYKQVESSGGGMSGVHFRWGAGAFANSSGIVTALATRRDILNKELNTNQWVSS